jgi:subtilase family protein/type IX secretion system substrate protein
MRKIFTLSLCIITFLSFNLSAQQLSYVLGDILVKIPVEVSIQDVVKDLQFYNGKPTQLKVLKETSSELNIWLLHFDNNTINENYFLHEISIHKNVETAQFNHLISMRQVIPDDPSFNQQWQWVNTGQTGGNIDADIDADLAWEVSTGGTTANGHDVVVCVVEAANRNHPDLQGNLWINEAEIPNNGVDDDNNGYIDDIGGWNAANNSNNIPSANHGTAVSGMIGAVGNNSLGVTGVNWNVKIMHSVVGGLSEANVIAAYNYPLVMRKRFNETNGAEGAFVVATNSSWGIDFGQPNDSPLWCAFYDSLGVQGILSCGATSNQGVNIDQVGDLPTACPSEFMVSVTATDDNDIRDFAGYGLTQVDLGAPGSSIYTLNENGYSNTSGTSFASPLTAGVIAFLYAAPCPEIVGYALQDPAGAALQIRDYIFNGVDPISNLTNEVATGGRINMYNSLLLLLENCGPCPTPSALSSTNIIDTSATLSWFNSDSALVLDIRYRLLGDTTWTFLDSVPNPFALDGLLACEEYEYQIESTCADTMSAFSESHLFSTDGCCSFPEGINVMIDGQNINFNWQSVYAAQNYNLRYREEGEPDWVEVMVGTESFSLQDLGFCKRFELQVETTCGPDSTSGYSDLIVFETECLCLTPENIDTTLVNMTNANIDWDLTDLAAGYSIRYKVLGAVNWNVLDVVNPEASLDSLLPCTNYQYQVRSNCSTITSAYSGTKNFMTACPVSTEELAAVNNWDVYPNPFDTDINIMFNLLENQNLHLEIFTVTGVIVYQKSFDNLVTGINTLNINDLQTLSKGVFFIKVSNKEESLVKRIIKN